MKERSVMLLGFTVPDEVAKELFSVDSLPSIQTHRFAWSLARALRHGFGCVFLASACPIQNFPQGRRLFFGFGGFSEGGFQGRFIGFVNLIVLKQISRLLGCFLFLPFEVYRRRVAVIFVHGVHSPFLIFAVFSRLFGIKACAVLTDPPGVVLSTDGFLARVLKRFDARIIKCLLSRLDHVVALAPELAERFPARGASLVFPGIVEASVAQAGTTVDEDSKVPPFVVVYAGTLNAEYGVGVLLDAIALISDRDVIFRFYGKGDQVDRIKKIRGMDQRVEYGGFVGRNEMLDALRQASLLVNPRPSKMDFARMSFPSKLIEYLAVGKPTLTTRLDAIPSDYMPHFYFIEDESAEGVASEIERIMGMSPAEMRKKGLAAREFVLAAASEEAVGRRIASLLYK